MNERLHALNDLNKKCHSFFRKSINHLSTSITYFGDVFSLDHICSRVGFGIMQKLVFNKK